MSLFGLKVELTISRPSIRLYSFGSMLNVNGIRVSSVFPCSFTYRFPVYTPCGKELSTVIVKGFSMLLFAFRLIEEGKEVWIFVFESNNSTRVEKFFFC